MNNSIWIMLCKWRSMCVIISDNYSNIGDNNK